MKDAELEFEWMFWSEYPAVLRTVFLILNDRAVAEEVTQEAFIQLLRHWRKVWRYERPDAWVRRVAIRLAVRSAKREWIRRTLERADTPHPPAVPDVDLARAVGRLPPMQRAAIVLYYFHDLPISDIVNVLDVSDGTVKRHLHRGRARLAELLGEEVPEDVH